MPAQQSSSLNLIAPLLLADGRRPGEDELEFARRLQAANEEFLSAVSAREIRAFLDAARGTGNLEVRRLIVTMIEDRLPFGVKDVYEAAKLSNTTVPALRALRFTGTGKVTMTVGGEKIEVGSVTDIRFVEKTAQGAGVLDRRRAAKKAARALATKYLDKVDGRKR